MSSISYLDLTPPKYGRCVELYPGIFWVRMQLPFRPGSVNVWLLSDPDGWTIVDAGFDHEPAREAWMEILAELGSPCVKRVLMTHAHFDHIGLAGWLCRQVGAELWIAKTEFYYAQYLRSDWDLDQFSTFYREAGCPEAMLAEFGDYRRWVWASLAGIPTRFVSVAANDVLKIGGRTWQVYASGGHSHEQLAFWCKQDGVLIGGDQLLPRIQPAIAVTAEQPEADPMTQAIEGWGRLSSLPPGAVVLPSHGMPFTGLHARVDELTGHYDNRLELLTKAASIPISPYDAFETIYGDNLPSSPRIAVGEMQACFNYLQAHGVVVRSPATGRRLYQAVQAGS